MVKGEAISMELRAVVLQNATAFPPDAQAANVTEYCSFALSTEGGLAGIPNISDVHCIYINQHAVRAGVGTYLPVMSRDVAFPPVWKFEEPILIPHPKIYTYIYSTNAAAAASVHFRLGYTYVRLTGPEVMEALEVWRSPTA